LLELDGASNFSTPAVMARESHSSRGLRRHSSGPSVRCIGKYDLRSACRGDLRARSRCGLVGCVEGSAGLPGGGMASGETVEHADHGRPADHVFGGGGIGLVVTGQAAVGGQPRQRPPHHPPSGWTAMPRWPAGVAHDLHRGVHGGPGPLDQPAGTTLVGEDVPDRGGRVRGQQGILRTVMVLPAGGDHPNNDQQAEGVGDDEPLPPVDLLTRDVAAVAGGHGVGGPHTLRVNDPRGGLRRTVVGQTDRSRSPVGIRSITPRSLRRLECPYTVCQGGKSTGRYRQGQPVRSTYRIASMTARRGCFSGLPIHRGNGYIGSMISHWASVRSEG